MSSSISSLRAVIFTFATQRQEQVKIGGEGRPFTSSISPINEIMSTVSIEFLEEEYGRVERIVVALNSDEFSLTDIPTIGKLVLATLYLPDVVACGLVDLQNGYRQMYPCALQINNRLHLADIFGVPVVATTGMYGTMDSYAMRWMSHQEEQANKIEKLRSAKVERFVSEDPSQALLSTIVGSEVYRHLSEPKRIEGS